VLTAALLSACGGGDGDAGDGAGDEGRIEVVASFSPLAEVARRVGGARVAVRNLTAPGAEPHDLELTPSGVDALEDADVVVVLGRGFQPAIEEVAARRDGPTVVVLDALDVGPGEVADAHGHDDEGHDDGHADDGGGADDEDGGDGEGVVDPHVWLDPTKMAAIVDLIEDALAKASPADRPGFSRNAEALREELRALDAEFARGLADCERRLLVTAHAAFGWLADRYGLEQEAIAGLEPDQEPSAQRLAELADLARAEGVTTVFTETLVSPEVAETLAREAGGLRTAVLDPLEGFTEAQEAAGADYFSVMRENLATLRAALGCR
jgi:zinc transport system substrate-binding protein